jgi:hypothetical protein
VGASEDFRKIAWIKWNTIFIKKEYGELRVERIREFNVVLFGKW